MGVMQEHKFWINHALNLAQQAAIQQEVPVGAVLVCNNEIIGEGWNQPISQCDPSAHAEILALRKAALLLGNYRLPNTTLYVTLEPCAMCLGAMIQARINRLIFGAWDARAGAVRSVFQILDSPQLNHHIQWQGGILAQECAAVLKFFFTERRLIRK